MNILYSYVTTFYHVVKMSINLGNYPTRSLLNHIYILMRVSKRKTTINKKVRAIEQIFMLDPVN